VRHSRLYLFLGLDRYHVREQLSLGLKIRHRQGCVHAARDG